MARATRNTNSQPGECRQVRADGSSVSEHGSVTGTWRAPSKSRAAAIPTMNLCLSVRRHARSSERGARRARKQNGRTSGRVARFGGDALVEAQRRWEADMTTSPAPMGDDDDREATQHSEKTEVAREGATPATGMEIEFATQANAAHRATEASRFGHPVAQRAE